MGGTDYGQRIKSERKKRGWSQTDLAKRTGVSQATISAMERDDHLVGSKHLPDLARALGVTVDYLTDGKEYVAANQVPLEQFVVIGGEDTGLPPNSEEYVLVPQYDAAGSCGPGALVGDVAIKGSLVFRKEWLKSMGLPDAHHLGVIYAQGDSNYPFIEDGQVLLVNSLDKIPKSGKVYLICIDGHLVIKRLVNMVSHWVMRSDNQDKTVYPDVPLDRSQLEEMDIQGRIVWRGGEM